MRIPWSHLVDKDQGRVCNTLPSSLEYLVLESATYDIDLINFLKALQEKNTAHFSALKHVHLLWRLWELSPDWLHTMIVLRDEWLASTNVLFDIAIAFSGLYGGGFPFRLIE